MERSVRLGKQGALHMLPSHISDACGAHTLDEIRCIWLICCMHMLMHWVSYIYLPFAVH